MKEVKYETPKVIGIFHEWYDKLTENEKSTLCSHLRNWLKTDGLISRAYSQAQPHFGGRTRGTASNRLVGKKEELKCTNCDTEIKLLSCSKCGNHVEIK